MKKIDKKVLPKNKDKYLKLIKFLKEVLPVCQSLNIEPILDGSLAILAHTKSSELIVNDVDFSYPEKDYPRLVKALNRVSINAEVKEWHVLQARKDNLKIEFSDIEHWYKGIPTRHEILIIDDLKIKMLDLDSLIAYYRKGLDDTKDNRDKKEKYEDILNKYNFLIEFKK